MEAIPVGFFSQDYKLVAGDGEIATLDLSAWRETAQIDLAGRRYELGRDGMFGPFVLKRDDQVVARATKPSVLRSAFEVEHDGRRLRIEKASFWGRELQVVERGETVGKLRRRGLLRRTIAVELPDDWPLELRVFVLWLALVLWRREDAAAAS